MEMKPLDTTIKVLINKIVQENIGQAIEAITEKVSLRVSTNASKVITDFQNKLAKELYVHCESLYARKECTAKQSQESSLGGYLKPLARKPQGTNIHIVFEVMLASAKRAYDPDSCLWRREGWSSNIEWVCLTNPQGKFERHFTAKTSTGYSIWMPTMEDMLAKDWARV